MSTKPNVEFTLYQRIGDGDPAKAAVAVVRLPKEKHMLSFQFGETPEAAEAQAHIFWDKMWEHWTPKIDKRKTSDPMARLAKALDELSARFGEK